MNASLQCRLLETIRQTLTSYHGAWLVWCDPRGDWLPLLERAAASTSDGFSLLALADETAGQSFALVVPRSANDLGWLWAPALPVQEMAWQVDIDDGVRVNVVPLQAAGLLAGDVLNRQSCPKPLPTAPAGAATSAAGSAPASCPGAVGWTKASPKAQSEPISRRSARRNR